MLFLIIYWLKIIHSIHKLLWVAMTLLGKDHVLHAILNPTDFSENLLTYLIETQHLEEFALSC